MIRRPPSSPLFPSPTLFRSLGGARLHVQIEEILPRRRAVGPALELGEVEPRVRERGERARQRPRTRGSTSPSSRAGPTARSEEHTSELQSQSNLVCRLLLEK